MLARRLLVISKSILPPGKRKQHMVGKVSRIRAIPIVKAMEALVMEKRGLRKRRWVEV